MSDAPVPPAPQPMLGRRRPLGPGSIQSKLMIMLLVSSILSAAVVGFFAYRTGTNSLRDDALERLTELREERTRGLQTYFEVQRAAAAVNSQGLTVDALRDFSVAYEQLRDETITPAQTSKIRAYYEDTFIPQLQKASVGTVQAESFLPTSPARTYLQAA